MALAIEVDNLQKIYKNNVRAVKGVSFAVEEGEIFGFLGPNGAGKSTTIGMLTTLLRPTGGDAKIMGMDIYGSSYDIRSTIGYVSQELAVDDNLTGFENIRLQAGLFKMPRETALDRIEDVMELVALGERAHDIVETYSGGMRKRLDIACGLIHRPQLLFLDEPTLGLDIQTRREIWRYINRLREEAGMTIFLTTHYMEEADALCDRIAIIDRGEIVAMDTPTKLKAKIGGDILQLKLQADSSEALQSALDRVDDIPGVITLVPVPEISQSYAITIRDESIVPAVFSAVNEFKVRIAAVSFKKPTLDDVFLHYTGQVIRDEAGSKDDALRSRVAMRRARRK